MPSWMAWVQRPSGLIYSGGKHNRLISECIVEVNIDNRSELLSDRREFTL
jgi:hypothetical protein